MNIIGIDSGSSIIKIIEIDNNFNIYKKLLLDKMPIKKALNKFLALFLIDLKNIDKIVLTGVGVNEIQEDNICNIPILKIDEFKAIGAGGCYLSNLKESLIVNIGTGTAFVVASNGGYKHIGGSRSWSVELYIIYVKQRLE